MDGFHIFCNITFGTSFDPKQKKRRRNKLKNYKKNKKLKYEESLSKETEKEIQDEKILNDGSSDSLDSSDDDLKVDPPQKTSKKKEKKKLSIMQLFKIRKEEVIHFRRTNKIYVTGDDIQDPFEEFGQLVNDYNVSNTIINNISKLGYTKPTSIQMQAIPLMLQERQILACAPTGSGKTAAFLIPIIHNLEGPKKDGIRAVIVAPTRELAKQINTFCVQISEGTGLQSFIIENEMKEKPEFLSTQDILITTPNRLIYLLKNDPPLVNLNKVRWLVVDECDKLFETGKEETGFREQLAVVYNACGSSQLRRAMFSATYTHEVEKWCRLNLDNLVCVSIGTKNTAVESVKQELLFTGTEDGKLVALRNFVQEGFLPPCLVFVQSKTRAKELHAEIAHVCPKVRVIHADLDQELRDRVVGDFVEGRVWILVCTELMGRGIDFKGVNTVINYDFPPTAISYIHRIGRTGRAGAEGRSITYFTTDDVENLKSIAQVIKNAGCDVPEYIMKLKSSKKKKNEFVRPIQRKDISTVPKYVLEKQAKRKKNIQDAKKKKTKHEKKT